ncbi:MAG TPA: hypothetical protein VF173_29765 [Thermoanaerobaculia bacterium]|nr:hypothetical protein [Thermoanaerobaculia bacterium]
MERFIQVKDSLVEKYLSRGLNAGVLAMAPVAPAEAANRAGLHVHAVGIGRKLVGGKETDTWAVRVYVIQKVNPADPQDAVPPEIEGIPTDVIESQPAFFMADQSSAAGVRVALAGCTAKRQTRFDPVTAGFRTGSNGGGPGTIACFCESTDSADPAGLFLALSCSHVFAGSVGADLFQPAPGDGLPAPLHFAELYRSVPIQPGPAANNKVDAAVGSLLPGVTFNSQICSIGGVTGTVAASHDMAVVKHGQQTGRSEGKIDDVSYTSSIGANPAAPLSGTRFINQIRILGSAGRFADFGDSGSLVVEKSSNAAVGLLFAVPSPPDTYACANPITDVLSALQLTII